MNCPNCGRPVSEKANICPRCKTHIYHKDDNKETSQMVDAASGATVKLDEERLNKKNSVLKEIFLLVIIIVILFVLLYIFKKPVIEFTSSISWLKWLADLLTNLSAVLPF